MLYPKYQSILSKVSQTLWKEGLEFYIFQNYRSYAEQLALYLQGRDIHYNIIDKNKIVTNAKPGYSFHNFAVASDWVHKDKGKWLWDYYEPGTKILKQCWHRYGEICQDFGLIWGGNTIKIGDDWDFPHNQLKTKISLEEFRNLYAKGGLPLIFAKLDEEFL